MISDDCGNCGGVMCMDCCGRIMHDECREDCPDCCPAPPAVEYVPKSALAAERARADECQRQLDAAHAALEYQRRCSVCPGCANRADTVLRADAATTGKEHRHADYAPNNALLRSHVREMHPGTAATEEAHRAAHRPVATTGKEQT